METRAADYQPPFERYVVRSISEQGRLAQHVPDAIHLIEGFYIQRYLKGAEVMQTGRDLLRTWAKDPEAKLIEARATLGPAEGADLLRRQKSGISVHPLYLYRNIDMRMRYWAYKSDVFPHAELEKLSFTYSQDKLNRRTELNFTKGTRVSIDLSGDEPPQLDAFEAMADLATSINFFSAEVFSRTGRVREDFNLARYPGLVVNFPPRTPVAKAA